MNCSNCGNVLRPNAPFCSNCGQPVPVSNLSSTVNVSNLPPAPPPLQPIPTPPYRATPIAQVGAINTSSSLWGPFSGYGTRREHTAWLLEGLGGQAEQLRDTITDMFNRRQIPNAAVQQVTLTGRGIAVEQRPFYRVQRGLSTVWLYVARLGQDMYISQVSYVKGPISMLRVIVALGLATLTGLWFMNMAGAAVNFMAVINSMGSGFFGGNHVEPNSLLFSTLCCTGPLGIFALILLLLGAGYSVYKFVTERDILALLRSPLNEFQEDDIVSLEKAVNETVRKSADMIGIDLKLLTPGQAYRSGRRLI